MKFKKEDLVEVLDLRVGQSHNDLTLVHEGKWVDDGKYSFCHRVFQFKDKTYRVTDRRTGSYYSDYYYESDDWDDEVECEEVEKFEVVTHEWRPKV